MARRGQRRTRPRDLHKQQVITQIIADLPARLGAECESIRTEFQTPLAQLRAISDHLFIEQGQEFLDTVLQAAESRREFAERAASRSPSLSLLSAFRLPLQPLLPLC